MSVGEWSVHSNHKSELKYFTQKTHTGTYTPSTCTITHADYLCLYGLRFPQLVQERIMCVGDSYWIILRWLHRSLRGDGTTVGCGRVLVFITILPPSTFCRCSNKWRCLHRGKDRSSRTRHSQWCHFIDWSPLAGPTTRSRTRTKARLTS